MNFMQTMNIMSNRKYIAQSLVIFWWTYNWSVGGNLQNLFYVGLVFPSYFKIVCITLGLSIKLSDIN